MKKALLFFFIGCGFSFAQDVKEYIVEQDSTKKSFRYALYRSDYSMPRTEHVGIEGSPYLDNRWHAGTASIEGEWSISAPMRYNAEREIIEYVDKGGRRKEFKRESLIRIDFGGKTYELLDYVEEGEEGTGYFNSLMDSGNKRLYFRPKIKIVKHKGIGSPWGYVGVFCVNASSYYIKESGKPAQKVKLNRKNLLNSLGDQRAALVSYINGYKLNLRKEADVIRLLKFYNNLSYYDVPIMEQAQL